MSLDSWLIAIGILGVIGLVAYIAHLISDVKWLEKKTTQLEFDLDKKEIVDEAHSLSIPDIIARIKKRLGGSGSKPPPAQ